MKPDNNLLFKDILENDDIDLDLVFKNSLMMDLAEVKNVTLHLVHMVLPYTIIWEIYYHFIH